MLMSHVRVENMKTAKHKPLNFQNTSDTILVLGKTLYNPMNWPKKIQNTRKNITHSEDEYDVTRDKEHVSKENTQAIQLPTELGVYLKYLSNNKNLKPKYVLAWKLTQFHI